MVVYVKVMVFVDEVWCGLVVMWLLMNLNKNLCMEQFDILVGGEVFVFYVDWFLILWDEVGIGGISGEVMDCIFEWFV